jgi:hypothetical protein
LPAAGQRGPNAAQRETLVFVSFSSAAAAASFEASIRGDSAGQARHGIELLKVEIVQIEETI